jgi:hypothetical protein
MNEDFISSSIATAVRLLGKAGGGGGGAAAGGGGGAGGSGGGGGVVEVASLMQKASDFEV